jgi:hypothetical protein
MNLKEHAVFPSLNRSQIRFQWQHNAQVTSVGSELWPNKEAIEKEK